MKHLTKVASETRWNIQRAQNFTMEEKNSIYNEKGGQVLSSARTN
jgi:hypothetical protein